MEEIEVRRLLCDELRVRQPGAVVLGRVARYGEGGVDRLLERRARDIGSARVAAPHFRPLAEVNRDADGAVAVVLDRVGFARPHRDGETMGFRYFALAAAGAG